MCVSLTVRVSWMLRTPTAERPIYLVLFRKLEYVSYYFPSSLSLSLPLPLFIHPHLDLCRFLSASFLSISTHGAQG